MSSIYIIGIVVIFVAAIGIRAALPPIPYFDADSGDYLQAALSKLATGTAHPTYRGFLYPAILWVILKVWPSFLGIIVVQHVVGLLAGVLLVVTWQRMRVFFPPALWTEYGYYLSGWLMLSVYVFSHASILYEHSIRPESLFSLVAILCILVATEFSRRAFINKSKKRGGVFLPFLLTTLTFTAYYLKPAWGLTVLTTLIPLFIVPKIKFFWLYRLVPIMLGVLFVFVFLENPERAAHRRVDGNATFLAQTLVASHGEVVYEILKSDATLPISDPRRAVADVLLPKFERAIQYPSNVPTGYTLFSPDNILWGGAMETLRDYCNNKDRVIAICHDYYKRAWKQYPFAMLRKIAIQLLYFYCPWKSVIYQQAQHFKGADLFQRSLQEMSCFAWGPFAWAPYLEYRDQVRAWLAKSPHLRIPPFIVALSTILNPLYTPMVLFAAASALWILFSKNTDFRDLRLPSRWCLYLLSYNFVMTFTIAVIHMVTVDRYHFSQTIFSSLSQGFCAIFLVCVVRRFLYLRNQQRERFSIQLFGNSCDLTHWAPPKEAE